MAEDDGVIKKSSKETAIPIQKLPVDVFQDILSRLPVKSLLRCRCVCKPWLALLTDPDFVKMHLSRSLASNRNLSLVFDGCHVSPVDLGDCEQLPAVELDHTLKPLFEEVNVLGSCNGLLCISNGRPLEEDIFLWNPSTRRHHKLPVHPIVVPPRNYFGFLTAYGFGYDPTTDDYKLVRVMRFFYYDEEAVNNLERNSYEEDYANENYENLEVNYLELNSYEEGYTNENLELNNLELNSYEEGYTNENLEVNNLEVSVYSLSTNSWRRIGADYNLLRFDTFYDPGVLANSALHWLARLVETECYKAASFIVSIDLQDEVFREFPIPDFVDHMSIGGMNVLGGQLCLVCSFPEMRVEFWVMKDYGVRDSWEKLFSINHPLVLGSFNIKPICYSKNGEILLQKDEDGRVVVLYDPATDRARTLEIRPVLFAVENVVESLVPPNAKDGTKQRKKEEKEQEAEEEKERGAEG